MKFGSQRAGRMASTGRGPYDKLRAIQDILLTIYYRPVSAATRTQRASKGDDDVPQHQNAFQFRAARERGRNPRFRGAIRAQAFRLQYAIKGQCGSVRPRRRRSIHRRPKTARVPAHNRTRTRPRHRGGEGARTLEREVFVSRTEPGTLRRSCRLSLNRAGSTAPQEISAGETRSGYFLCLRRFLFLAPSSSSASLSDRAPRTGPLLPPLAARAPWLALPGLPVVLPCIEHQMQPRHHLLDRRQLPRRTRFATLALRTRLAGGPDLPCGPSGPGRARALRPLSALPDGCVVGHSLPRPLI